MEGGNQLRHLDLRSMLMTDNESRDNLNNGTASLLLLNEVVERLDSVLPSCNNYPFDDSGNSATSPELSLLLELIEQALYICRTNRKHGSNDGPFGETAGLTQQYQFWLFLAKCAVLINARLTQEIVEMSHGLAADIRYWEGIIDSPSRLLYHYGSTLPLDLCSISFWSALPHRLVRPSRWLSYWRRWRKSMKKGAMEKMESLTHVRKQLAISLGIISYKQYFASPLDPSSVSEGIDKLRYGAVKSLMLAYELLNNNNEIDDIPDIRRFRLKSSRNVGVVDALNLASQNIELLDQYPGFLREVTRRNMKPSWLTRRWIPITLGTVMIFKSRSYRLLYPSFWKAAFESASLTIRNFVSVWIWQPVSQVWSTIRYRESHLNLLGSKSLESDLQSLERMVVDYAKSTQSLNESDINQILASTRNGDLTMVYKRYEEELHAPLRNVVTGDLVRLLLIQIQKSKVDLEVAMSALDKLLKANELNFAFLAIVPAVLAVYWGYRNVVGLVAEQSREGRASLMVRIREQLDGIERVLLLATNPADSGRSLVMSPGPSTENISSRRQSSNSPPPTTTTTSTSTASKALSPREHGELLLSLLALQRNAHLAFPPGPSRRLFLQSVSDLAASSNLISHKMQIIQRMYRTLPELSQ